MSSQHIRVLAPVPVKTPQGAIWAAQGAVWLARKLGAAGAAIWKALEEQGERRAARELHNAAQRWDQQDPALARALRLAGAYMDPSQRRASADAQQTNQTSQEAK